MARRTTKKHPRKARPRPAPRPVMVEPLPRGRPSLLTPALAQQICSVIAGTKASLEDAAGAVGVGRSTLMTWLARGRMEAAGLYRDFLDDTEVARSKGTVMILGRLATAGKEPRFWQADVRRLEMTERRKFGPQVRITVEEELEAFIERLRSRVSAEIFEAVVAVLDGQDHLPPRGADSSSEGRADDSGGGEAVQPPPAAPEATDLP